MCLELNQKVGALNARLDQVVNVLEQLVQQHQSVAQAVMLNQAQMHARQPSMNSNSFVQG